MKPSDAGLKTALRNLRPTSTWPGEHLHLDNHNAIVAERNRQIEVAEKDRDRWKASAEKLAQRLGYERCGACGNDYRDRPGACVLADHVDAWEMIAGTFSPKHGC